VEIGGEGKRKKDKSLQHVKLIFRHPVDDPAASEVFDSDVTWRRLMTGQFRSCQSEGHKMKELVSGGVARAKLMWSVAQQARLIRF
jgi:hypothetical protein